MVDVARMRDGVELWKALVRIHVDVVLLRVQGSKWLKQICTTYCRLAHAESGKKINTGDVENLLYKILFFRLLSSCCRHLWIRLMNWMEFQQVMLICSDKYKGLRIWWFRSFWLGFYNEMIAHGLQDSKQAARLLWLRYGYGIKCLCRST
jgi:hypothetical protein